MANDNRVGSSPFEEHGKLLLVVVLGNTDDPHGGLQLQHYSVVSSYGT